MSRRSGPRPEFKPLLLTGLYVFLMLFLTGCEIQEVRYETVADAREAGLYARGWAPDVLPDGAGPIREAHDLDTNARCLVATIHSESVETVQATIEVEGFSRINSAADLQPEDFCPFAFSDLAGSSLFHRDRGDGGIEYAALSEAGTFYYWGAPN